MKNADRTKHNPITVVPSNPYAKISSSCHTISTQSVPSKSYIRVEQKNNLNSLWADKYAPSSIQDLLGNVECVRKLRTWLNQWEITSKQTSRSLITRGPFKAALLSSTPRIGKKTSAVIIARSSGRVVFELNASDTRNQYHSREGLGDITGSKVLSITNNTTERQLCITIDEVDGMGAGDRSGIVVQLKELLDDVPWKFVTRKCLISNRRMQQKCVEMTCGRFCLYCRFWYCNPLIIE